MIYLYDKTGKPVVIEDYQVSDALGSGEYFLKRGPVNVYSPDGQLGSLDAKEIPSALQEGYRLENQEEAQQRRAEEKFGDIGAPVVAGVRGALKGATLGLSDAAAVIQGGVDPQTLRMLDEAYPTTTTASEVAGAVGGALLTKKAPAALVSKLGRTTSDKVGSAVLRGLMKGGKDSTLAQRVLSKGVGRAAGGAVEGGLYGAGGVISEKAIGDPVDLGEALVAHVGPTALLGGVIGVGAGALSDLSGLALKKTAEKIGSAGIASKLEKSAFTDALGAVSDMGPKSVRKMLKRRGAQWSNNLRKLMFEGLESPNGEVVGPIAGIGKSADDLASGIKSVSEKFGSVIGSARGQADELGAAVNGAELGARVAARIEKIIPDADALASKADRKLYKLLTDKTPKEWAAKGELGIDFMSQLKKSWRTESSVFGRSARQEAKKMAAIVEEEVRKSLDGAMKKALPDDVFTNYKHAQKGYSLIRDLADEADQASWAQESATFFDRASNMAARSAMWRLAAGGLGGGAIGGVPGAVAGAVLMSGVGAAAKGALGPTGTSVLKYKLASSAVLQKAADAVDNQIANSIKRFLAGGNKALIPASATILKEFTGESDSKKAYRKARDTLSQWRSNPETAARLSANLAYTSRAAPDTASHATMVAANILNTAPIGSDRPMSLQPMLDLEEDAPMSDIRKFAQKMAGKFDPVGSIRDFGNLNLSYTQAEAFREGWPRLAQKVTLAAREVVATHRERLSREQLFQLSILAGEPLDERLSGNSIARYQSGFAPSVGKETPPPPNLPKGLLDEVGTARLGMRGRMEKAV